jgi:hypothetical protein
VTSDGHAYARFRRALEHRALWAAEVAAREIPQLSLEDALQLVHLYADRGSPKFERAAMRWLERYLTEARRGSGTSPRSRRASRSASRSETARSAVAGSRRPAPSWDRPRGTPPRETPFAPRANRSSVAGDSVSIGIEAVRIGAHYPHWSDAETSKMRTIQVGWVRRNAASLVARITTRHRRFQHSGLRFGAVEGVEAPDLGREEEHGHDHGERDAGEDERVLGDRLPMLVAVLYPARTAARV